MRLKNKTLMVQTACEEYAMLDSLDAKERSYDNSTNGINFTIREVNLMFVFIVVVCIFFFNKYIIQNLLFFVYNVIMSSIVYAIVLWPNFYVKLLMSSAKAASMNVAYLRKLPSYLLLYLITSLIIAMMKHFQ